MSDDIKKGLLGIVVDETEVSKVMPEINSLTYRGYAAQDLCEYCRFEEVAYLILNKDLPNTIQLRQFEKEERNNRELTKNLYEIIKHMPKKSHPMDVARTAVSVMGLEDKETTDSSPEANMRKALRIFAKTPTALAAFYRIRKGKKIIKPKTIKFPDHPEFTPNLTPKQVLQSGAFGGTYYRDIHSAVTGKDYSDAWREFPEEWFSGLNIKQQVTRKWEDYDTKVNKCGVKVGTTLEFWQDKNWIREQDPYGWFQWYCRFYRGRRTDDDERQIDRWNKIVGPNGRFRRRLMNMLIKKNKEYDDYTVSPVIRQVLLHWGYELTKKDFDEYKKSKDK